MKFRCQVENGRAIQLCLEKQFELAVRFGRIDVVPPKRLTERWTRTGYKSAHRLTKLKLKQKRRSRPLEPDIETQLGLVQQARQKRRRRQAPALQIALNSRVTP